MACDPPRLPARRRINPFAQAVLSALGLRPDRLGVELNINGPGDPFASTR
jgi:hypothetical protein